MRFKRRPFLENRDTTEIEWFKESWGKEPKIWTVEDLYPLWLKTKKRLRLRRDLLNKCIEEIVEKITPTPSTDRGRPHDKYVVYYKHPFNNDNDRLYKTVIQYASEYECYSRSNDGYVGDSENIVDKRNDIIDSMVDGDLRLELGEKYRHLDNLTRDWFSGIVMKNLWEIIEDKLRKEKIKDQVFPISICGDEFYVVTKLDNYHYPKYDLVNKIDREQIKF
tara:strand:+ start:4013 stop:4675 length:663 start_codon:yes stop_codon:yes gene_type:complete